MVGVGGVASEDDKVPWKIKIMAGGGWAEVGRGSTVREAGGRE